MSFSRSPLQARSLRTILASAVGSVALILAGCSDQSPAQNDSTALSSDNAPAVQASDVRHAAAPADANVTMAFPTGNRSSSDLLIEETGPGEVRVGQRYQYQIRVTNLRNVPLSGIMLDQRIPANFQLESTSAVSPEADKENRSARTTRINVGDLGPNESKVVQMAGIPMQKGTLDTCLSVRYNPPMLCSHINVVAPALGLVAEGPSQADLCQDLNYRITVTNTGSGTAHNVVLEETLPEGVQTVDGRQSVSANIGDITAGQNKSVTVRLRAQQPGNFVTQAYARSDDAGKAHAEQVATAVLAPRLAVTVAGPKQEYLGEPMTFQVTVTNKGDAPASGTKVRLGATPGAVAFVNAQNAEGAKISQEYPGTGQELGTLAPGESRTVAVTFKALQQGRLSIDATAEAKCAQPVTTPINAEIEAITASALVVTHDPDPVRVGNDVVYHITVMNKGTASDQNVNVTATLPASLQFIKADGATTATANGQTITFAAIPQLAAKEKVTWKLEARALHPAETQLQVEMTSASTKKTAVKIEPTKLYGENAGQQERTNEAKQPAPLTPTATPAPTPAPAPAPAGK